MVKKIKAEEQLEKLKLKNKLLRKEVSELKNQSVEKEFIDKMLKHIEKSHFGDETWFFKKLFYDTAKIDLPEGEFALQCRAPNSEYWETFATGTKDGLKSALEWNKSNATTIGSGKKFRVVQV